MTKKGDMLQLEFARLQAKHRRLTPDLVVREARAKTSPLHQRFIWDDKNAAHLQRLDVARELLSTYVTVVMVEHRKRIVVPMYVHDPSLPSGEAGYIRTTEVKERDHAEAVLKAELDRIEGCVDRARGVADLFDTRFPGVAEQLEVLLSTIMSMRNSITRPPPPRGGSKRPPPPRGGSASPQLGA